MSDEFYYLKNKMQKIDGMDKYQRGVSEDNRTLVIEAILELKKATPKQIEIYIKYKYKNEKIISESTIKRHLKKLMEEDLLVNIKGTYFPSSKLQSSPHRYIPEGFGASLVNSLGYFFLESIEKSFNELLVRFGSIILFTFIEAAHLRNETNLSDIDKDYFNSWLTAAIPLVVMWKLFLGLYGYNENKRKNPEKHYDIITSNKINPKMLQRLELIFKEQQPKIYQKLKDSLNHSRMMLEMIKEIENERDTKRKLGKLKNAVDFAKKIKNDSEGKIRYTTFPPNVIRGYVSSRKWRKEFMELQNNDSNS